MIKLLIVEDNPAKLNRVAEFLLEECSVQENEIHTAGNVREARDLLFTNQYDLLLLDLVLPMNDEDQASSSSGLQFLDEIYYNPNINIPIHILGLTEFDNIFKDCIDQFEDKLWGLLNFHLGESDWSLKLKSKIHYLQSFHKSYKLFIQNEKKYDVAIITALNEEFEQLKSACQLEKTIAEDTLVYYSGIINTINSNNLKIVACCINDMGMQSAAAVSSKVIAQFSPNYLFMTGICAGLESADINLGDIVIAKQIWDYETGKISDLPEGGYSFKPSMKCIPTNQGIITRLLDFTNNKTILSNIQNEFRGNKPKTQLTIKCDSLGSGPYLLRSKNYFEELLQNDRKLIAVDMEGYGVYKAASFYQSTIPVLIKGISDFGDPDKKDDLHEYASFVSAKFVIEFLRYTM